MLRPLTTGEVLDRTFHIYRKNFLLFAGIAAVPQALILFVKLGLLGGAQKNVLAVTVAGLLIILLAIVGSAVATAATTFGVSDIYLGKETSISSCFKRVRGTTLAVMGTSLLYGLAIMVGFIFLVVPGIYLLGRYGLSTPAVVLEDRGPISGLNRSSELTKGSVLRVLVVYFLSYLLIFVIAALLGGIAAAALDSVAQQIGTTTSKALTDLTSAVANVVITPVLAIALTVLYYDQRVRKEAFDIENMMSLLGEPAAPDTAEGATAGI
jgi:hypothetical protein